MLKKRDFFFDTLEKIAENLLESTIYFDNQLKKLDNVGEFAKKMKEFEQKGDGYTHAIIAELNKTFITPIEREDIMALTTALDDVLDGMETCSSRFDLFEIKECDKFITDFSGILLKSVREIHEAIRILPAKKLMSIRANTIKLNELENEADEVYRNAIKKLFATERDAIELMKRKEIYELLENTTDDCEDVANTLETIIMKNS